MIFSKHLFVFIPIISSYLIDYLKSKSSESLKNNTLKLSFSILSIINSKIFPKKTFQGIFLFLNWFLSLSWRPCNHFRWHLKLLFLFLRDILIFVLNFFYEFFLIFFGHSKIVNDSFFKLFKLSDIRIFSIFISNIFIGVLFDFVHKIFKINSKHF